MDGRRGPEPARAKDGATVERKSDRELVITRSFDAPAHLVYKAWTTPDLFRRWWAPKSAGVPLFSCDMDVRAGGGYRVAFGHDAASAHAFFGKYIEVIPNVRLAWTNEEGENGAGMEGGMPEQFAQLDGLLVTLQASA